MAQANPMQVSGSKLDNRRVLAALIDVAVVALGGAVILAAGGVLGDGLSEIGMPLIASILGWALYYYFACESGAGQTLGKRAMKIRVVREDGSAAGMREVGLRTVLRVIDMQLAGIVGLVVMNSTKERRARLGDLVGHTKVVSADGAAGGKPAADTAGSVPATPVSRVPIAESGPAFAAIPAPAAEEPELVEQAPEAEAEPEVVYEAPLVEAEAEPEPELESASLSELASDVSAVTEDREREVAEEPELEEEPALEEEPELVEEPEAEQDEAEQDEAEQDEAPTVEADALEADALEAAGLDPDPLGDDPLADDPRDDEDDQDEELDPAAEEAAALEAHEAEVEGRVSIKSVETVSAMDIVMGQDDGESSSGR
jgi:uncharacterized RDD family membrane protein YckC